MLGEKIGEGTGQVIGQRVLEGHRMEVSVRGTGKLLGLDMQETITYEATMRPDGSLQGTGRGIAMGANGEAATYIAAGIGTMKASGDVAWRGAFFYTSQSKTWSKLNGTCVVFEAEVTAKGESKATLHEWK